MISLIVGCATAIQAQEEWTMDRCIQYAVEHSTAVEMQLVEARQNKADYTAAKLSFLPTIEAGVSAQYSWGRNVDPETNT